MNQKHVEKAYRLLKNKAIMLHKQGQYAECLEQIRMASTLTIQFNWKYKDDDIEVLLQNISRSQIDKIDEQDFYPKEDRIVFIDDFCRSFILTLQYLDAFKTANLKVLYITFAEVAFVEGRSILDRVKKYENVDIKICKCYDKLLRAQEIYSSIVNFQASKIFLHVTEFSDSLLALYSLPSIIKRYMINLSDQRFWLGVGAIDYSIEFRTFGATVSYEKRGLKKEQLLYVPFYPIEDNNPFDGFPSVCQNKVIIFTGGDFYKTLDPKYTFWKLLKKILINNEKAIILYAMKNGTNSKSLNFINRFIKENNFENRFISIGFRSDINEVFKHCDIFMGTCPTSGSLMSQLAAHNTKPILQYYLEHTSDDETEQAICYNEKFPISFSDEVSFLNEAKKLIDNPLYRISQGVRNKQAMLNSRQFTDRLLEKLKTHDYLDCTFKNVNYKKITERWFYTEKMGYIDTFSYVSGLLGKRTMVKEFPLLYIFKKISMYLKNI